MEELTLEIRRLVYTVICFQCILQFGAGSAYQRYLKLFAYFLTICMCCGAISSFVGKIDEGMLSADRLYGEWRNEWQNLLESERINDANAYYTDKIWSERILNEAYATYESGIEGGEEDGGADNEMDEN